WRRLTRRYRWLTHALLGATRKPPARAALLPVAQRLPWLFSATVAMLARPADERATARHLDSPQREWHRKTP
ncbi:hypothetical protein ACWDZW_15920, partial [Streptomyces coeruleorubidus]